MGYFMLPAPRIAPISNGEIGEQNMGSFAEYCSRDSGYPLKNPKVDKSSIFSDYSNYGWQTGFG